MNPLEEIVKNKSLSEYLHLLENASLSWQKEAYSISALEMCIKNNIDNDFFESIFKIHIKLRFNNELVENRLIESAIDYNSREKYDIISASIVDEKFYERDVFSFYTLYKSDAKFLDIFKIIVPNQRDTYLHDFVDTYQGNIIAPFINAIFEHFTQEKKEQVIGEVIASCIINKHTEAIDYFTKYINTDLWLNKDKWLEQKLRTKGPAHLRELKEYRDSLNIDSLLDVLIKNDYPVAQYYMNIKKSSDLYHKMQCDIIDKNSSRKLKL